MRAISDCLKRIFQSKAFKGSACFVLILFAFVSISLLTLNMGIIDKTKDNIYSVAEIENRTEHYDCILVLGAGVRADGSPTPMLNDRLNAALSAYRAGASSVILVSGDSEKEDYRETDTMKRVLVESGVSEESIVCDEYGLSTYESIWRAKNVYGYKNILIVTQGYHLYRALFVSEKMGLCAKGVDAALQGYAKQPIYSAREIFARAKDFYYTLKMPKPKYTGK